MDPSLFLTPEEQEKIKKREVLQWYELPDPVVKTDILVGELNLFRLFLDANDMSKFQIGYYSRPDERLGNLGYESNYLCYSTVNKDYLIECNLMHMNMKYGSLEKAFNEFRKEYRNQL